MKNNFLNKQINDAKDNYNYFFVKLIFSVLKVMFKLSIVLLISGIFNYTIINIMALIYTIYSLYAIGYVINYYMDIINDIKNILGYSELSFVIDFNLLCGDLLKGVVKYGK